MKNLSNLAKKLSEKIYKMLGKNSGQMLLITSIIGISTSCLAQTGAILLNKKYTNSQKSFMIPQELTEGLITVLSIFIITKPCQKLAEKLVKSGKILTNELLEYYKKNNLTSKRGKANFDFTQNIEEIIQRIEKSDRYIKSSTIQKEELLKEHKKVLQEYNHFNDSTSAFATTIAGLSSTAIVSPILRNHVASYFHQASLNTSSNSKKQKNTHNMSKYYNNLSPLKI